jgi:DNA-binding NtrC family response regulator
VPAPRDETWDEVGRDARVAVTRPSPHLFVVLDCDRPLSGSSRHALRGVREVTLGRGNTHRAARDGDHLAVTLPSRWLSSQHARIVHDQGPADGARRPAVWRLEDLGSRNGTRVNGERIVQHALRDGDCIEVGHTLLLFREAMHGPPAAPLDVDTATSSPAAAGLATLIPALAAEIESLVKIAPSKVPTLLLGETGTGKEVVARALHALSQRPGAFVAVNCGAIPESLIEAQLFGHTKGAFSGAIKEALGFLRAADGGTLLLDEIGDLPKGSQAALLRALQEGEVVPVGATHATRVDLRVVAATHHPLEALVARGDFRADLLARLDGFRYALPPLRERREDLGILIGDLLARVAPSRAREDWRIDPEAAHALFRYDWPLNVRELQQCLLRSATLASEGTIAVEHLPAPVAAALAPAESADEAEPVDAPIDPENEPRLRAQLERLLEEHRGNVAEVARAMGKARMQIHRWMKRLGMDPDRFRR